MFDNGYDLMGFDFLFIIGGEGNIEFIVYFKWIGGEIGINYLELNVIVKFIIKVYIKLDK